MPIDHLDVRSHWQRQQDKVTPRIEYRTVEMSEAWSALKTYLEEKITEAKTKLEADTAALRITGNYSHEHLITKKVLIDIAQAELLILESIAIKVQSFHAEAP